MDAARLYEGENLTGGELSGTQTALCIVGVTLPFVPWDDLLKPLKLGKAGKGVDNAADAGKAAARNLPPHLRSHIKGIQAAGKYDARVASLDEARKLIGAAMPDAVEIPPAIAGQPYPSPPTGAKQWYQLHPPEPGVGNDFPHFKYADWSKGKKKSGGSWGHVSFPEVTE